MKKLTCLTGLVMLLSACSGHVPGPIQVVDASSLISPEQDAGYMLGSGDKLRISVYGEDNLSGEQQVGPDGNITLPLVGEVPATGKTVADVAKDIQARLAAGYLRSPSVAVVLTGYRPFYILGEVNTPGQYEYTKGMSVSDAVARAGGYTYRAKKTEVFIRRDKSAETMRVILDYDPPIRPGDTIHVGERHF